MNEGMLLLSSYILFYYTDYNKIVGFEDYKYNAGWVVMGLIMTTIICNIVRILKKVLLDLKKKLMSRCTKKGKKVRTHQHIYSDQFKIENDSVLQIEKNHSEQ